MTVYRIFARWGSLRRAGAVAGAAMELPIEDAERRNA
jgi:hypothetical protein